MYNNSISLVPILPFNSSSRENIVSILYTPTDVSVYNHIAIKINYLVTTSSFLFDLVFALPTIQTISKLQRTVSLLCEYIVFLLLDEGKSTRMIS